MPESTRRGMDFVWAIGSIVVVIGIALLLGRLNYEKNPVGYTFGWIGSILFMLSIPLTLDGKWNVVFLLALSALSFLGHLPAGVFYVVGIGLACAGCWYILNLIGSSIIELAWELKETNARITRLESSLVRKLDDIGNRLTEGE